MRRAHENRQRDLGITLRRRGGRRHRLRELVRGALHRRAPKAFAEGPWGARREPAADTRGTPSQLLARGRPVP